MPDRARRLMFLGMVLFVVGLVSGLAMPLFRNPRMGLSAHLEGVLNGLFLMAAGLVWPHVRLAEVRAGVAWRLALLGTWGNWAVTTLAAILGTKSLTPIASAGFGAGRWQETLVTFGFATSGLAILAAAVLLAIGLAGRGAGAAKGS